jgi:aspartyl protease family protein
MLVAGFVIALALLTWFFSGQEAARVNPNGEGDGRVEDGVPELRLVQDAKGHYVVEGRLNGTPVTFLLDTGATDVAIPEALAERLALPRGVRGVAQTANGLVDVTMTRIDRLSLGPITLRDVRASIGAGDQGDLVLLGMSALRDVELVQSGRELRIRDTRVAR